MYRAIAPCYHLWFAVRTHSPWNISRGCGGPLKYFYLLSGTFDTLRCDQIAGIGLAGRWCLYWYYWPGRKYLDLQVITTQYWSVLSKYQETKMLITFTQARNTKQSSDQTTVAEMTTDYKWKGLNYWPWKVFRKKCLKNYWHWNASLTFVIHLFFYGLIELFKF